MATHAKNFLKIASESMDFMVTSPPILGILNKQDQKVKKNRVANNLETKYSESEKDLGNVENYDEFLEILVNKVFLQCARTLKYGKYMAIVVSDFRDKSEYISFHSDLIHELNKAGIPGGGIIKTPRNKNIASEPQKSVAVWLSFCLCRKYTSPILS